MDFEQLYRAGNDQLLFLRGGFLEINLNFSLSTIEPRNLQT